ncbi:MAG: FHA domain-containing protein [Bacteriovorax sp.]|jgi:pSer/pThr/pTyr-binding forkhead associated (FHA) protein|nr:FHA domain-containing protein [Bacteriovorax sp.]
MNRSINVRITTELKAPKEPGTHFRFLCMTGPNKGKVYYLTGKRITIGRGEEADIQIVDTKISREHAELSFANGGYTITDLGAQNGIIVNDSKIKQKSLIDNEKVVIGQTVFKYNVIEVFSADLTSLEDEFDNSKSKESTQVLKMRGQQKIKNMDMFAGGSQGNSTPQKKGGSKILIFGIVIAGVLFILLDNNDGQNSNNNSRKTTSSTSFDRDFDQIAVKKIKQEDADVKRKLESLIHSGRREFSEGNYFRAIEDFRLALLISPNNGHASFYLSKAKQSLDDDIKKNFEKGKQEYESKKLQSAVVSYCSVVQLIQNYPNDERYKSAMLQISAIESELGMEKGEIKCFEAQSADSKN